MPTVQHGLRASLSRQNAPASGAFQDWRRGAAARGAGCSTAGRVPDERAYLTARAAKDAPPPATPPPQPATLLTLPLFHLGGLESFLLPFTASGGKVVLMYKWDAARRRSSEGSCIGLCPASESRHLSSGAAPRDRTGSRQSPRPTIQQLTWPCVPRARHRPAVPRPAPHQLGRRPGRRWLGHPAPGQDQSVPGSHRQSHTRRTSFGLVGGVHRRNLTRSTATRRGGLPLWWRGGTGRTTTSSGPSGTSTKVKPRKSWAQCHERYRHFGRACRPRRSRAPAG